MPRGWILVAGAALLLGPLRSTLLAQDLPGRATDSSTGFITRSALAVSFAGLVSGDPRFTWSARIAGDVDIVSYPRGRLNFWGEYEGVLGSERRELDLNHENYQVEMSTSRFVGEIELALFLHHQSRHVVDRESDRVVAWNDAGIRAMTTLEGAGASWRTGLEFSPMLQHTFVDYAWHSRLVVEVDRPLAARTRLVGGATLQLMGIDDGRSSRDRQCGARFRAGILIEGRRGDVELYAAYERRIDGFPLERTRKRFFEFGFTLRGR
jgi:hypothetical protein